MPDDAGDRLALDGLRNNQCAGGGGVAIGDSDADAIGVNHVGSGAHRQPTKGIGETRCPGNYINGCRRMPETKNACPKGRCVTHEGDTGQAGAGTEDIVPDAGDRFALDGLRNNQCTGGGCVATGDDDGGAAGVIALEFVAIPGKNLRTIGGAKVFADQDASV